MHKAPSGKSTKQTNLPFPRADIAELQLQQQKTLPPSMCLFCIGNPYPLARGLAAASISKKGDQLLFSVCLISSETFDIDLMRPGALQALSGKKAQSNIKVEKHDTVVTHRLP